LSDLGERLASLSRQERALLFERLRSKKEPGEVAVERRPEGTDPIPLSFAQERLWFLDRLTPGDPSYNVPIVVRVEGELDAAALGRALYEVGLRHESLRTRLTETPDGPVQVIDPEPRIDLARVDLTALGRPVGDAELARLADLEAARPFDLEAGPLARAVVALLGPDHAALLLTLHHVVSDGWSMGVLVRDVGACYRAALAGRRPELAPLPVQYPDYALWQRRALSGEALARLVETWRRRLAGAPSALALPTDRPRPPLRTSAGGTVLLALPARAGARLAAFGRSRRATPFMALLTAWNALLFRYTGAAAIPVGTPVANRERRETLDLIGFFVNTLVLLGDLAGDPPFELLLERLRDTSFEAFAHQELPFEKLVEELRPERDPSRTPIFQVMCTLQNTPMPPLDLGELRLSPIEVENATAKYDLSLTLTEVGEELVGSLAYSTDLFDAATAVRLGRHLGAIIEAGLAAPREAVSRLPMLGPAEVGELLGRLPWRPAKAPAGLGMVHEQFAARAAAEPERPAVASGEVELSYGELARRSGELARRLRQLGVGPEERVAVAAVRAAETVVAILGALEAGGAYVPIDPLLPEARRQALAAEGGCKVWLEPGEAPGEVRAVLLSTAVGVAPAIPAVQAAPENAAYVLFTSGSTGTPKGVVVEHRQLSHYVAAAIERLELAAGESWTLVSTFAADLGHTALFPCLVLGGRLEVASEDAVRDPELFAALAAAHPADAMKIVPSHLAALLANSPHPAAVLPRRRLVLGGEATSPELLARIAELAPGLAVFNHYGPTEATVGALAGPLAPGSPGPLPLGKPMPRVAAVLLGRCGELVPPGVPGELCLGGAGVARGYLGRPDLTAERFVPDPWGREAGRPGGRLYRTGDLARRLADGTWVWLGRTDDQIKVRGFRIEPREVEAALEAHPGVGRAAVLPRPVGLGGRPGLVAWVQPVDAGLEAQEVRAFLRQHLPAAMVPDLIVPVERLPLSPNGKVDRQALAALPLPTASRPAAAQTPRTATERLLSEVWAEVLGLEQVGREENFFDLGGHSLLLARLQRELRLRSGVSLPLLRFFEFPTVATLAASLDRDPGPASSGPSDASRERASRHRQLLALQRERRQAG
jgi:amino acid adenylation domain-containing protein